uniref:Uncharacterized protein n=1 Tax=Romanomermis culicivorax TaxID=13658 RepID=A0A915HI91_ROMCU
MVVKFKLENTRLMVYQILKIFEVWHYNKEEQYHPTKNPEGGVFTQYVNTFMKMKLFGQQNNMDKTIIHNSPKEYSELIMNVSMLLKMLD